jgi:hypothetical protein
MTIYAYMPARIALVGGLKPPQNNKFNSCLFFNTIKTFAVLSD